MHSLELWYEKEYDEALDSFNDTYSELTKRLGTQYTQHHLQILSHAAAIKRILLDFEGVEEIL